MFTKEFLVFSLQAEIRRVYCSFCFIERIEFFFILTDSYIGASYFFFVVFKNFVVSLDVSHLACMYVVFNLADGNINLFIACNSNFYAFNNLNIKVISFNQIL